MTQQQVMNQRAEPGQPDAPAISDQLARQEAIKQIERRRRFWVRETVGTVATPPPPPTRQPPRQPVLSGRPLDPFGRPGQAPRPRGRAAHST